MWESALERESWRATGAHPSPSLTGQYLRATALTHPHQNHPSPASTTVSGRISSDCTCAHMDEDDRSRGRTVTGSLDSEIVGRGYLGCGAHGRTRRRKRARLICGS